MTTSALKRPCPVCGGLDGRVLSRLNFAAFDDEVLPAAMFLSACSACGHVFYDAPGLTQALVDRHYQGNRYLAASPTPGAGGSSEADQTHYRQIIERLEPWAGPDLGRPVYDLGCGRGGLLKALIRAGYEKVYGVEILPEAVALIKAEGLAAKVGSVTAPPEDGEAPGLLIYSHVLEHLAEPGPALAAARRVLAPGGLIYVELPDASDYDPTIPWRQLYQEHLSHFGRPALATLLTRHGFEVLALKRSRFHLPGGRSEGILWAVARPGSGSAGPVDQAEETAAALEKYLKLCAGHPMMEKLRKLADSGAPLRVWGLSQMTLLLLGSSPLGRANISGYIDADPYKQSRRLKAQAVQPPSALAQARAEEEVLLTVLGLEDKMEAELRLMGFQGRIHRLGSN